MRALRVPTNLAEARQSNIKVAAGGEAGAIGGRPAALVDKPS